tara:strand:- start:209 stop:535 length:327 start_codon:yes stop_codon:yes gene_type:complete
MKSQIFKLPPSKELMYDFLKKWAIKNNTKYYYVSKMIFRRALFKNDIKQFCDQMKQFYFSSKEKYVTRTQTYKTFMTVLRQICKYHHIPFVSKIKYDRSLYQITYYIY